MGFLVEPTATVESGGDFDSSANSAHPPEGFDAAASAGPAVPLAQHAPVAQQVGGTPLLDVSATNVAAGAGAGAGAGSSMTLAGASHSSAHPAFSPGIHEVPQTPLGGDPQQAQQHLPHMGSLPAHASPPPVGAGYPQDAVGTVQHAVVPQHATVAHGSIHNNNGSGGVAAPGWVGFSPPHAHLENPHAADGAGMPTLPLAADAPMHLPPSNISPRDPHDPPGGAAAGAKKRVRFSVADEARAYEEPAAGVSAFPPPSSSSSSSPTPPPAAAGGGGGNPADPQWHTPVVSPATPPLASANGTPPPDPLSVQSGSGSVSPANSLSPAAAASNTRPLSPALSDVSNEGEGEEASGDFDQILNELQCPVCLDTYQEPVTMGCGHTLCKEHIFDLASMLHHPDTGIIEFDCPKCRDRCSFPSAKDVKTNFEMKSMITLVLKAAQKTKKERRSDRERKLMARVRTYETAMSEMQARERRLETDRERLVAERKKLEEASKSVNATSQQQQIRETDKLTKERKRLEREKMLLQRQKEELELRSHQFLRRKSVDDAVAASPHTQKPWHQLSLEEKERELERVKNEQEAERARRRAERDRKIEEGLQDWLQRAHHVQQQSLHHRLGAHRNIADLPTDAPESPPPYTTPNSQNKYAQIRQLPAASPEQQQQHMQMYHTPQPQEPVPMQWPAGAVPPPSLPSGGGVGVTEATPSPGPQPPVATASTEPVDPPPQPALQLSDGTMFSLTDPAEMLLRRNPKHAGARNVGSPAQGITGTGPGMARLQQQQQQRSPRPAAVHAPAIPKPNLDSSVYAGLGPINPITGFPDPRRMEAVDDTENANPFRHEADAVRHMQKHNPPKLVPEDYANYEYGVHDPVDHELHDILDKVDRDHEKALAKAHEKKILAEKARIAEERALAMVAKFKSNERERRLSSNEGWDRSAKGPTTAHGPAGGRPASRGVPQAPQQKRLPPQTKLARRVQIADVAARKSIQGPTGGQRASNPVNVVRRVQ